jgi:hypothetical protein
MRPPQLRTEQPREPLKARPRADADRVKLLAVINNQYEHSLRRLGQ